MTTGILVALLAGFYAFYQLSYDKFVKDHDRIYRLEYIFNKKDNINHNAACSQSLAMLMKEEFPGIKDVIVVNNTPWNLQLSCDDKPFKMNKFLWVSPNFPDYYKFKYIYGTKESKGNLFITESLSNRYFPGQNPIGKEIKFQRNNVTMFTIGGVIKNLPPNSHIQSEAILVDLSPSAQKEKEDFYKPENLALAYQQIYIVLENNTSINDVLENFPKIKQKYLTSYLEQEGYDLSLTAINITKTHFQPYLLNDFPTENINTIYYFLLTAFVIIIISIINYINLSLARFAGRKLDIGIRKTLGASNRQIFRQYISESYLFILFSFVLALLAFYYLLPNFCDFNGLELDNARISTSGLFLLVPILLFVGFLAGFYPALITTRQNPQFILQNRSAYHSKKGNRFFIILQLVLSIVFFMGTIVIFMQLKYSQQEEKGYNLENVIVYEFSNFGTILPSTHEICNELETSSYINDVAVSSNLPGQELWSSKINIENHGELTQLQTELMFIDHNYLPFAGIELLYGNNFDNNLVSDSFKVVVNTTFAKSFGSIENAIGKRVYFPKLKEDDDSMEAEIIGVVKDFHFQSMHKKIAPLVLYCRVWAPNYYHIKFNQQNFKFVLEDAQKVFDEMANLSVFGAVKHFPEEELLQQYKTDRHLSQMTIWLAILSMVLAILGVFGLTAFLVRNNLKMLCIRKVFGAEMIHLFKLLFHDYSVVLIISNIIALPLAWYVCTKWLERFAYRISLPVWLFALGITMSLVIVFLALSYHVFKVINADPVIYLKDE